MSLSNADLWRAWLLRVLGLSSSSNLSNADLAAQLTAGNLGLPGVKATRALSSPVTLTNGASTTVPFSSPDAWDDAGFHDPAVNNTRITIPVGFAGRYIVRFSSALTSNATGRRIAHLFKNGVEYYRKETNTAGAGNLTIGFETSVDAAEGDYFEVKIYHTAGVDIFMTESIGGEIAYFEFMAQRMRSS